MSTASYVPAPRPVTSAQRSQLNRPQPPPIPPRNIRLMVNYPGIHGESSSSGGSGGTVGSGSSSYKPMHRGGPYREPPLMEESGDSATDNNNPIKSSNNQKTTISSSSSSGGFVQQKPRIITAGHYHHRPPVVPMSSSSDKDKQPQRNDAMRFQRQRRNFHRVSGLGRDGPFTAGHFTLWPLSHAQHYRTR